jgi:aminobenzoyl-glutamate transport protein
MMLPYSMGLLLAGLALVIGWVALDLPLGPGAGVHIDPAAFTTPAQGAAPAAMR